MGLLSSIREAVRLEWRRRQVEFGIDPDTKTDLFSDAAPGRDADH